ncbi:MAG: sister chromatid cohesion protein PDS5 [Bacteroidota bacterium]
MACVAEVERACIKSKLTPVDKKALRYCILRQLGMLSLHAQDNAVRVKSLDKLQELGQSWSSDRDIEEELKFMLLDGLGTISQQSAHKADKARAKNILESWLIPLESVSTPYTPKVPLSTLDMSDFDLTGGTSSREAGAALNAISTLPSASQLVFKWLSSTPSGTPRDQIACTDRLRERLSCKLNTFTKRSEVPPVLGLLYRRAEELLAQQSSSIVSQLRAQQVLEAQMRDMQSALKAHYKDVDFRTMPSFLGEAPMSVEIIECHLKLNEQKKIEKQEGQDQFAQREERLQWVKTPIEIIDLFKKRSLKPKEPEKEINKVLLVGEAGTGKTSLTKKLAYDWSKHQWGQEFTAVYILPVRALREDKYDNKGNCRTESTLATAIANECFTSVQDEAGFKKLRRCIEASLNNPSTLVILDGLDEQHGTSEAILRQAKTGNHKLLLTSRPYGIETERSLVDIEVDHMGLDESQRDNFVKYELTTSVHLLQFIRDHQLGDMSFVPVNLKILCSLWRAKGAEMLQWGTPMGLPSLYRKLVDYVWERFEDDSKLRTGERYTLADQRNLFKDLEQIALESLKVGSIIINRTSVRDILCKRPPKLLETAGFLLFQNIDSAERVAIDPRYQFPHLTFQEYFTGRCLARQFLSGERQAVTKFLRQHMYTPRYRRTFAFMSGEIVTGMPDEVSSTASGDAKMVPIQALLQLVAELPEEILGLQYLMLQLRILNEWLLMAADSAEKIATLSTLEIKFHLEKNLITWFNKGLHQYKQSGDKAAQALHTTLMAFLAEASGVTNHYSHTLLFPILNALQDSGADVHIAALQALPTLLYQDTTIQELLPHILNALQDSDAGVRTAALEALPTLLGQGATVQELLPYILNALKDSDVGARNAARETLPTLLAQGTAVQELLPPILNALQDSDAYVCIVALETLPTLLTQGATVQELLPPILDALKDIRADVGITALEVLRTLSEQGAPVQELLPHILNMLRDSHAYDYVRIAVLQALQILLDQGAAVQELLSPILNALGDSYADVRKAALQILPALAEHGAAVRELLPYILNALKDNDHEARRAALEALPALLEQGATIQELLPPILNALQDSDPEVRRAALQALLVLVEQGAEAQELSPYVLNAFQDNHADVRIAALQALGTLLEAGAPVQELLPSILNAFKDSDANVRWATLQTLRALLAQAPAVQELLPAILKNALKDSDADVRTTTLEIVQALLAQGASVQKLSPSILNALKDSCANARNAALEALRTLLAQGAPVQKLLPPILKVLKDSDANIRVVALQALGILLEAGATLKKVSPSILNALKDSEAGVRRSALETLRTLLAQGASVRELSPSILNALRDSDAGVRNAALEALRTLVEQGVDIYILLPDVLNALQDGHAEVRIAILEALQILVEKGADVQDVLPSILNALKDRDADVHNAAMQVLEKISTESVIDYYWETEDETCIAVLVPRLYEVALTLEDMESSGQQKLVLRSVKGDVVRVWEKMQEEVEGFKRLVQGSGTCFG